MFKRRRFLKSLSPELLKFVTNKNNFPDGFLKKSIRVIDNETDFKYYIAYAKRLHELFEKGETNE